MVQSLMKSLSRKFLRKLRAVTKKIFEEFIRTNSWILTALPKLNALESLILVQSGTFPGLSRDTNREKQENIEQGSQNYVHPEVHATLIRPLHTVIPDPDAVLHSFLRKFSKNILKTIILCFLGTPT